MEGQALVLVHLLAEVPEVIAQVVLAAAGARRAAAAGAARGAAPCAPFGATAVRFAAAAVCCFFGGCARLAKVFEADLQAEALLERLGKAIELGFIADELQDCLLLVQEDLDVENFQGQALFPCIATGRFEQSPGPRSPLPHQRTVFLPNP